MAEAKWYIVHTYAGYEDKVKSRIEMTVQNRQLQDVILEVAVPIENGIEIKNGKKVVVKRKLLPSYVIVHMVMNEDSWYVVRNTLGVTGFVGPDSKPVPMSEQEVRELHLGEGAKDVGIELNYRVGDMVTLLDGIYEGKQGIVKAIDVHKQKVVVGIDMFGRETAAELAFTAVKASTY